MDMCLPFQNQATFNDTLHPLQASLHLLEARAIRDADEGVVASDHLVLLFAGKSITIQVRSSQFGNHPYEELQSNIVLQSNITPMKPSPGSC